MQPVQLVWRASSKISMHRPRRPDLRSPKVVTVAFWYADSPGISVRLEHPNQERCGGPLGPSGFDSIGIDDLWTQLPSLTLRHS